MATKNFRQNSAGKSFEQMSSGVTDLSTLAEGFPSYGSSMAAGSTLTDKDGVLMKGAPGSTAEQTSTDIDGRHNTTPDLDLGGNIQRASTVNAGGKGGDHSGEKG